MYEKMSTILNSVYGHAILEYLLPIDVIMMYRVDRSARSFLTSNDVVGGSTFESWICKRASGEYNIKGRLLVCMELDMMGKFKSIVEEFDPEGKYRRTDSLSEDDEEEMDKVLQLLIDTSHDAIRLGKIEYLDALKEDLYVMYDWDCANYDDYSFDFMDEAVKCNRPSVVKYLLTRDDEEGEPHSDQCVNAYLHRGLKTAVQVYNRDAITFFFDHPKLELYDSDLDLLLHIDDNDLFDKYIDRVVLLYFWYDSWFSIRSSLSIPLRNNNEYLRQKVIGLVLSRCRDDWIIQKAQSYTSLDVMTDECRTHR